VRAAHAAPCSETESNGYGSTSSACALNIAMRADARVIARSTDPAGCVRYMPARVASSWESLVGRSMVTEYDALFAAEGRAYSGAQPPPEGRKSVVRAASQGLCMPLTILWAIETLYADDAWTRRDELVIHVRVECRSAMAHADMCADPRGGRG
jgi:splicing suppressor protein 51